MGQALLSGSALAALLAGMVAFFAPCCAFVMLPTYLASVAGARKWRTAGLTAVFVAGVATVVWPLTVGAAGLSQLIAANHETMFLLGGSMMLAIGVATLRGWMWHHTPSVGGGDPSGVVGIYLMGVFSGAATACCAPVLAGAVAIAGVSGSWWVGALLGAFYLFGLVSPLLVSALGVEPLRRRLRDPSVTVTLAGWRIRTTVTRLVGGVMFLGLGALLIALALTGNARTAPGFQKAFGRWLSAIATDAATAVPAWIGWIVVLCLAATVTLIAARSLRSPRRRPRPTDRAPSPPPARREHHRSEPQGPDLEGVTH